jgi:hypothetical protein
MEYEEIRISKFVKRLKAWQSSEGAFWSVIVFRDRKEIDWNGFVTALVLRELRRSSPDPELRHLQERSLDFLEQCASNSFSGVFSFWPCASYPKWASQVPGDIDDTALMSLELFRYGRLRQQDLLRIICKILIPQRIRQDTELKPPWIVPGAFLTWISVNSQHSNIVDCCVNANVVALMASVGATHLPGYKEACMMIEAGLQWAGDSPLRLRSLTPFYPNLQEFYLAVKHAVECGACLLQPSLDRLFALTHNDWASTDLPICSSAYHATMWYCPAISEVRQHHKYNSAN